MNLRTAAARAAWPLQRACTAKVIIVRRSPALADELVEAHDRRLEEVARAREARVHQEAGVVVGLRVRHHQHRRAGDALVVGHVVGVAVGVVGEPALLEQELAGVLARPRARVPARGRAAEHALVRLDSARDLLALLARATSSTARSSASRGPSGRGRARASTPPRPGSARAPPRPPRPSPARRRRRRCGPAARRPRGCRTRSATRCRDRDAGAARPGRRTRPSRRCGRRPRAPSTRSPPRTPAPGSRRPARRRATRSAGGVRP